jgi:hypothetical protein
VIDATAVRSPVDQHNADGGDQPGDHGAEYRDIHEALLA